MNTLEINEMVDLIDDFVDNPMQRMLTIGGMAGTQLFKLALDSVLNKSKFESICVIEGCQDYIGITSPSPCNNHFYYADIFREIAVPKGGAGSYEDGPLLWNEIKLEYNKFMDINMIGKFDYLIINDIQLIPIEALKAFMDQFPGKIIGICDPYEWGAERYIGYPNIVDTLTKVSAIVSLARSIYDVSSRSIEKNVRCSVTESKIHHRSIGRIDDRQYVTSDKYLADEVWNKQIQSPFRKGQRLLVTDDRLHSFIDKHGNAHTVTKNSMLVIDGTSFSSKKLRLRLFSSKFTFESEVSYMPEPPITSIRVRPANIITIDDVRYHKYQNMALVSNDPISPRQRYTLLKNTHNLVVSKL